MSTISSPTLDVYKLRRRVSELEGRRQVVQAEIDIATIDSCSPARFLELLAERTLLDRTLGCYQAKLSPAPAG